MPLSLQEFLIEKESLAAFDVMVLNETSPSEVCKWVDGLGGSFNHGGIRKTIIKRRRMISGTDVEVPVPKQPKISLNEAAPNSALNLKTGPGRYVVTCAQNDSEVDTGLLEALKIYCEINQAQLVVLPIRYRNVSAWNPKIPPAWSPLLIDYYLLENAEISPSLMLRGHTRIAATASDPLSGWSSKGQQSAVFGHGQIALRAIASPMGHLPALLMATGSITKANFANAKVSEIAEFHHSLSALVLTVHPNDTFDFEWVSWNDDHFMSLDGTYSADGNLPPETGDVDDLVFGDWHSAEAPKAHKEDAFKLAEQLKPKRIWLHDAISFISESHHLTDLERIRFDFPLVHEEVSLLSEELARFEEMGVEVWFPDSNHHRHVDRWLAQSVVRYPDNALLYHLTKAACIVNPDVSPFECLMYAQRELWINVPPREGFRSHGIELALHGDIGANGSRGSARGMARLTHKTNTGHSHSPEWHKGSLRQGTTGPIDPPYARGYNSAMLVHSLIWSNGTRTLISRVQAQVCVENGNNRRADKN